jgi:radical SAM protein (TIGR01212 family)
MSEKPHWDGIPYYPISHFYKQRFGERVQKIPVSVADTCPNRMGLKGMQTCSFCDVWGSAAYPETRERSLHDQIEENRTKLGLKNKVQRFLVYFQAYTNTFTKLQKLRENFDVALSFPDVCGVVVGTRPDCLSKGVLDLWTEYHRKSFVAVELGVQSFFDDQLQFLRRGHSAADSIEAIYKIRGQCEVDLGIHLMFGQPGESDEQIVETARLVSQLPIDNVKLHNLHVLKNTPLEHQYARGEFVPIDLETYAHRVRLFIQHLNPQIAVHRLAALSSRWDELVAPEWTKQRMRTHQAIIDTINAADAYQGQLWQPQTAAPIPQWPRPAADSIAT